MSPVETNQSNAVCESCGEKFSCEAETGRCWCFEFQAAPEDLALLAKTYQNCLCRECFRAMACQHKIHSDKL